MAAVLRRPPLDLAVGETVDWTFSHSDYDASDGWALSYYFRGPTKVDLAGTPNGSAFDFSVVGSTFEAGAIGGFVWEAIATKGSERVRLATGRIRIAADAEALGEIGDQTTHNERMLEALESSLENVANSAQKSYTIGGRSLERMTLEDLRLNRDIYFRRVCRERELAAAGLKASPNRVAVRLR